MISFRRPSEHVPAYAIRRPVLIEDVPGVRAWLRSHPDGGWLNDADHERIEHARRLLFVLWLVQRGLLHEQVAPGALIRRAAAIPQAHAREGQR